MYYRYTSGGKWNRIKSSDFFSSPLLTERLSNKIVEIKHESTSPKQKEQQLKFVRNGKIHLAIANLKAVYFDKSIALPSDEMIHLSVTVKILLQKLS